MQLFCFCPTLTWYIFISYSGQALFTFPVTHFLLHSTRQSPSHFTLHLSVACCAKADYTSWSKWQEVISKSRFRRGKPWGFRFIFTKNSNDFYDFWKKKHGTSILRSMIELTRTIIDVNIIRLINRKVTQKQKSLKSTSTSNGAAIRLNAQSRGGLDEFFFFVGGFSKHSGRVNPSSSEFSEATSPGGWVDAFNKGQNQQVTLGLSQIEIALEIRSIDV